MERLGYDYETRICDPRDLADTLNEADHEGWEVLSVHAEFAPPLISGSWHAGYRVLLKRCSDLRLPPYNEARDPRFEPDAA
jgi:hypothetical protein